MERSTKQGSADIEALRDQINQADESKKKLEEKYVALSDNFEHLKQRFVIKINQILIIFLNNSIQ